MAAGEAVPEAVLPLRDYRGVSAPRRSAKDIGWGLCPQTPEVYCLFLRGSATGICSVQLCTTKKSDTVWHRPLGSQPALGSLLSVALSSDCWYLQSNMFGVGFPGCNIRLSLTWGVL